MKKLILMCMIFGMIALASAQLTFEPEAPANIKVSCFDGDSAFCSATAECNITVFYPNMSLFVDNGEMTNSVQYFNYTTQSNLSVRGEYNAVVQCEDANTNGYSSFTFLATDMPMENQGIVAIGIMFSILAIAFMFLIIGFKLSQSDTYFPIALFFILIAIVLGVYVINLGYLYNRDMLISEMTSSGQLTIYIGIFWGLLAVTMIALLFLIIKTIREIKARKSAVNYGEFYDNKTNQYQ